MRGGSGKRASICRLAGGSNLKRGQGREAKISMISRQIATKCEGGPEKSDANCGRHLIMKD